MYPRNTVTKVIHHGYLRLNTLVKVYLRLHGSEKLAETFNRILTENPTVSVSLIDLSIKLDHIQNIPFSMIKKMKEELISNNLIGYNLLRALVVNHMYMFKINYKEKQRICELLDISIETQRKKELQLSSK